MAKTWTPYVPTPFQAKTVEELALYVQQELQRVNQAFILVLPATLQELHEEPQRPRTGLIALADGTDWNPGTGQGVYCYYNSTWNKLG